jgi:tetratricopeptide (TPR) repeat protein
MSNVQRALVAIVALTVLASAGAATAQIPDEFTNLKVLPKDIGKRELVNIMRSFSGALGVRCNHCHVGEEGADLSTFDFASDEKEAKVVSRVMMRMTGEINDTHLPKLERENVTQVRCITCHHGVDKPKTIDSIVLAAFESGGVDEAMAAYREKREEYYGRASYDFGAAPLNSAAEDIARKHGDIPSAIAIMKMNLEFNPDQSYSHLFLGQLYQMSGDKAAAIASVEKAIELDPENEWAIGVLEKMKASE